MEISFIYVSFRSHLLQSQIIDSSFSITLALGGPRPFQDIILWAFFLIPSGQKFNCEDLLCRRLCSMLSFPPHRHRTIWPSDHHYIYYMVSITPETNDGECKSSSCIVFIGERRIKIQLHHSSLQLKFYNVLEILVLCTCSKKLWST